MLKRVIICNGCTGIQAEEAINQAIQEYPDSEVGYELLIENSVWAGLSTDTRYTVLINIVSAEAEE